MDTTTHLALAGLALCDALDEGATDAEARIKAVDAARRHYHAVIAATVGHVTPEPCLCQPDRRPDCNCYGTCICDLEPTKKGQ